MARPRHRSASLSSTSSPGMASSEFKLAVAAPTMLALLAAVLEWADKLPLWAKTPAVLIAALISMAFLGGCYIVSRGLAKYEPRGPLPPDDSYAE